MKRVALVLSCLALLAGAARDTAVLVWTGTLSIPTYAEGPANPNAPFDLFSFGRFNYPYPIRDALTDRRETVAWRTLNLENEYLRLTVLPDLGGHVYRCLDKRTGREMFYANPAIKKALIGYRGAWAAFGIEFNFPVSHNWMSLSPVDFSTARHEDGSASIFVGNIDRVYGMQWRVELRLAPGRSALEQRTELYNPSRVRHRYYWWNNAAVEVWDDSRLVYPTQVMATHGFTRLEPWPIDRSGRDLSVIRNQAGPVSLFTYGTREAFVGVYHPRTSSGTVHVADPAELPAHKVWSWGHDRDAEAWSDALSDDHSAYVELQSGLFRNQETYAFLEPQETVRFSEYWLPVRDLGGITRANADAILYMQRDSAGRMRLALDPARELPDAHIAVRQDGKALLNTTASLSPREVWRTELAAPTPEAVTIELSDAGGAAVLQHTERQYDLTPADSVRLGPQPDLRTAPAGTASADEALELGTIDEMEGRRQQAMERYIAALNAHPDSFALLKAAGRLAIALGYPEAQRGGHATAVGWLEAAHARNTTDVEVEYYLGAALAATRQDRDARALLQRARRFRATRAPATLELARMSARQGNLEGALALAREMAAEDPRAWQAGAVELSALRRLGRKADARQRGDYWRSVDPTNSILRFETSLTGDDDPALWEHLSADAERVLDVVDEYLALGAYSDALLVIERACSTSPRPDSLEPGAVPAGKSPLVWYYRAYLRADTRAGADSDYARARALPTTYVFPSRHSSYAVFDAAIETNHDDATARFLLGSLYLSAGLVKPAIDAWQETRRLQPGIPTLHRNLALALLYGPADFHETRAVLEEGITVDRSNVELYQTLDAVLSAEGAPPAERVAALRRFPSAGASADLPVAIVVKLAQALAEAGEAKEAERLFHGRFFPREEGGTSIRTVYAQVRLASAFAAARQRDCVQAFDTLDGLLREREGLGFTAGGLAAVIDSPPMALQAVKIEAACDRPSMMRPRLVRLARAWNSDAPPLTQAIADEARRRLGRPRTAAELRRLATALDAVTRTLDSGTTSNPGMTEYTRALLLDALGRRQESRHALRRVFIFPDRNLSHALARNMMMSR